MTVSKEQAEMFLGVAAGLKLDIVDVAKGILEKAVLVGADMICESQAEIDVLTSSNKALYSQNKNLAQHALDVSAELMTKEVFWRKPETNPDVPKNEIEEYWVAVKVTNRPLKGAPIEKTVVFAAQYVNKPLELDKDGYPTDDEYLVDERNKAIEAIGWYSVRDHESFDNYYSGLEFSDDYVLLGWADYDVPEFVGVSNEN